MVDYLEKEKLRGEIAELLKDPFELQRGNVQLINLNFVGKADTHLIVFNEMLEKEKRMSNKHFKYVITLPFFKEFLDCLFSYLDEIYYIEMKMKMLELEKLKMKIVDSETERLNSKAQKLAQMYAGLIYKTVWRKHTPWEAIYQFLEKMVKKVYADEKETDIVNELCNEFHRVIRTSSFNKGLRERTSKSCKVELHRDVNKLVSNKSNIDAMMEMMKLRKLNEINLHNKIKQTYTRSSYRPYLIKNAPLKAKNSNSVLVSTLLDVVKDRKIVEYRIKSKKVRQEHVIHNRNKIRMIIDGEFDLFKRSKTEANNLSSIN